MTTDAQHKAIADCLEVTVRALTDVQLLGAREKCDLLDSLNRMKIELGIIKPVVSNPYIPTEDESNRMATNGEH
jgi:hypothetical protein